MAKENRGIDELNLMRKISKNIKHNEFFPVADRDYVTHGVYYPIGNLRDNATSIKGNSIVFDGSKAPYITYLEYGTRYMKQHMGFIGVRSVGIAVETIFNHYRLHGCTINIKKGS